MTPLLAPVRVARPPRPRLAVACAVASAAIGAAGVVFLVAMFVSFAAGARSQGMAFGRINDTLILVSFPLIVPAMLVLRERLRPLAPRTIDLSTLAGLAAVGAIVILQTLLVRGDLTFEEQIGWVSIAFIMFDLWLLVVGRVGSRSGVLRGGVRMALIGATYIGYPAWALWAARRLAFGALIRPTDPSAA